MIPLGANDVILAVLHTNIICFGFHFLIMIPD